jgi:phosphoglycerate dehydrogenase-like enzyme
MKVLLAAIEGEAFFDSLNDLAIPGLEIVRTSSPDEVEREIVDTEVIYGFPGAAALDKAAELKWIQSPGAGVDWVTRIPRVMESDWIVTNTRGAHGPSIAEHVFALLLSFTRNMPRSLDWQRDKYWGRTEGYRSLHEIKDSTMGIVGFGQIGRAIAKRADAFEMNVLAVDAFPSDGKPYVDEVWPTNRLPELLERSDVVVIAVPFTAETRHLIDEPAIAMMRPGSYLIAISRGGIVEETALVDALRSGHLAGAGLDVAESEPPAPDSPLWDAPNLLLTPHCAGASGPKEKRCLDIFRDNLIPYANGEPLVNVVDKQRGY